MLPYELLAGRHSENGVEYIAEKGRQTIVNSRHDLVAMFPGKFARYHPPAPVAAPIAPPQPIPQTDDDDDGDHDPDAPELPAAQGWIDVTVEYPDAAGLALEVWDRTKGQKPYRGLYVTATPGDPRRALNKKPLKAAEIAEFLEDYEPEGEE